MKTTRPKTKRAIRRIAPYTRGVRSQLPTIDVGNQRAFNRWLDVTIKDSKHSIQTDLPSSQLPKDMAQVDPGYAQLFAVVDTCSIVRNTIEFMDCVTNLKRSFPNESPIKFIISLTVLEELDKCNRPVKKAQHKQERSSPKKSSLRVVNIGNDPPIDDLLNKKGPPRSFMRFIEEEVRAGQILIGQLDPFKTIKLPSFEIINKDDRILECCLRSEGFIKSQRHHQDTRLILITEDNIFKTKATTFGIASFRWREFMAKYGNFGRNNCVPTPVVQPRHSIWEEDHAQEEVKKSPRKIRAEYSRGANNKKFVRKFLETNIASPGEQSVSQQKDDIVIVQEVITLDE